ncbi:MAG: hypothetical protein LBJ11_03255 [Oscillospiraceae bacterium]|jgi:molybdopterin synthase catalytic subunit|nr:hypothetical protein [Oscillospiraceae bacterium]
MLKLLEPQALAALIAALGAVIVAILGCVNTRRNVKSADLTAFRSKLETELETMAGNQEEVKSDLKLAIHRIGELEHKQDAANVMNERLARMEEREKSTNHRLDRMEDKKEETADF